MVGVLLMMACLPFIDVEAFVSSTRNIEAASSDVLLLLNSVWDYVVVWTFARRFLASP